jgi:sulfite reductase (NADPH) flavoprotein alpha-component
MLGLLAHSYWHSEVRRPERLPPVLDDAWTAVCKRLGRSQACLTYVDGIINNWRLPAGPGDPLEMDPLSLELLVSTVGNPEENIFYLTQVALLGHTAELVEAACRMQECVLVDDAAALKGLFAYVRDVLDHIARFTLLRIDVNPASAHPVDQTVWTKTVASTFVPVRAGVAGASGSSTPAIHLLDVLFGRETYDASHISRETMGARREFPRHWQEYFDALGRIPILDYVRAKGDQELTGLLATALSAYAGDTGFLERHRLKVYGFLDTAFKIGRDITIGGYDQRVQKATWEIIHADLQRTRKERLHPYGGDLLAHTVRARSVSSATGHPSSRTRLVRLDVTGRGVRYEPGDRVGILAENADDLVERTLLGFGFRGDELAALDAGWRRALSLRPEYRVIGDELAIRELLRHAQLRPVRRDTLVALLALAPSELLARVHDHHLEDEFELWDLLKLARTHCLPFDERATARLLRDPEALASLLHPLPFRTYSIA